MEADIRNVRIERYFPDVLASADDFKALATAVDPELIGTWKALWKQMLNTFVYDLDADGAARWEDMLSLYPSKTDSLDTRKKSILAKINSTLPYTERSFQAMLNGIYGSGNVIISLKYSKYELWLDVVATLMHRCADIRKLARVIVPANLTINISNTKNANVQLFAACRVRQIKHYIIKPSRNFSIDASPVCNAYAAGHVRRTIHYIIK